MTKKDKYNANPLSNENRMYVNGETAIKPYGYLRNGLLHVRYTVDRCIELSPSEIAKLKVDMACGDKQEVLLKAWNFFETCVGKTVIMDGVAEMDKRFKEIKDSYGRKDKSGKL